MEQCHIDCISKYFYIIITFVYSPRIFITLPTTIMLRTGAEETHIAY